jgi:hypothetical protein
MSEPVMTVESLERASKARMDGLTDEQRDQLHERHADVMADAISTYTSMRLSGYSAGDIGLHSTVLMACIIAHSKAAGQEDVTNAVLGHFASTVKSMVGIVSKPLAEAEKMLKSMVGDELPPSYRL